MKTKATPKRNAAKSRKTLDCDAAFEVASVLQKPRKGLIAIHDMVLAALEQIEHRDPFNGLPQVGMQVVEIREHALALSSFQSHMFGILTVAGPNPLKTVKSPESIAYLREMVTGKKAKT